MKIIGKMEGGAVLVKLGDEAALMKLAEENMGKKGWNK